MWSDSVGETSYRPCPPRVLAPGFLRDYSTLRLKRHSVGRQGKNGAGPNLGGSCGIVTVTETKVWVVALPWSELFAQTTPLWIIPNERLKTPFVIFINWSYVPLFKKTFFLSRIAILLRWANIFSFSSLRFVMDITIGGNFTLICDESLGCSCSFGIDPCRQGW